MHNIATETVKQNFQIALQRVFPEYTPTIVHFSCTKLEDYVDYRAVVKFVMPARIISFDGIASDEDMIEDFKQTISKLCK